MKTWILIAGVAVWLFGCATKPVKSSLPMPPKIARSKAEAARIQKSQELHPFVARETFTFHVQDCTPQPEGVSYRVDESADAVTWILCDSATMTHAGTNHAVTVRCDKAMGFFVVTAFRDDEEKKARKECD